MKPVLLLSGVLATWLAIGVHSVRADGVTPWASTPHVQQVDDDDEGDDGGRWLPFWFGLGAFAPRRQVIVEPQYYYGPSYAPPPPAYAPPPRYWYYCREPEGYYPNVRSCPDGWMKVVPGDSGAPP